MVAYYSMYFTNGSKLWVKTASVLTLTWVWGEGCACFFTKWLCGFLNNRNKIRPYDPLLFFSTVKWYLSLHLLILIHSCLFSRVIRLVSGFWYCSCSCSNIICSCSNIVGLIDSSRLFSPINTWEMVSVILLTHSPLAIVSFSLFYTLFQSIYGIYGLWYLSSPSIVSS